MERHQSGTASFPCLLHAGANAEASHHRCCQAGQAGGHRVRQTAGQGEFRIGGAVHEGCAGGSDRDSAESPQAHSEIRRLGPTQALQRG
eukprot:3445033-Alexandrium_andersonii.AAC.1